MPKTKKTIKPIERLTLTIDSFISYIRSLPEGKLQASPSTFWGAREVLVHLVFWHEQYSSIIKAIFSKSKPILLTGTFKELNTYAVEKNRDKGIPDLLRRLTVAQKQVEGLLREASIGGVKFQLSFREGSKVWQFEDALDRIEKHIQGHLVKLKKYDKN